MFKTMLKGLVLVLAVVFVTGCASTNKGGGGITTRAYVQDKERVDQDMTGGNYGYIQGAPAAPDRTQLKKTRQVYVLEFTKEDPEAGIEMPDFSRRPAPAKSEAITSPEAVTPEWAKPVALPPIEEVKAPAKAAGAGSFLDYEVQKGDTLQKISKKFYDTYAKWMKIYDANKETITDPNRLKAGMKLRIPMDGAKAQKEESDGEGPLLK